MAKARKTVQFLEEWISRGIWAALGAVATFAATFWMNFRKDKREDRGSEIQALRDTMHELREEVERVRERQIEDEKREDLCRRSLRIVIDALQAARIPVPTLPTWPASRE